MLGTAHFLGSFVRLKVGLRSPVGLMSAAPPAGWTVSELTSLDKVAWQLCVVPFGIREATLERLGEDGNVTKRAPIRPTDRWLLRGGPVRLHFLGLI